MRVETSKKKDVRIHTWKSGFFNGLFRNLNMSIVDAYPGFYCCFTQQQIVKVVSNLINLGTAKYFGKISF